MINNQIILLLSQDFTDNTQYIREVIDRGKKRADMNFYHFDIPSYDKKKKFIRSLTKSLEIKQKIEDFDTFKSVICSKIKSLDDSNKKMFLLITNFENGNYDFTKKLAFIIRDLKIERNFFTIIVGGKYLASMRYKNGELSPLNNAKELLFPSSPLENGKINLAIQTLHERYYKQICRYLKKETLGRFFTWSNIEVINLLFWKNLIVEKNGFFVWQNEEIKKIIKEYIQCED